MTHHSLLISVLILHIINVPGVIMYPQTSESFQVTGAKRGMSLLTRLARSAACYDLCGFTRVCGFRGAVACRHALGHGKLLSRAPWHVFAHSSAGWVFFSFLFWFEPGLEDGEFSRDFTFSQHLIRKTGLFWEYFSRLSEMEQKIKWIEKKNTSVCDSWSQFVFYCHQCYEQLLILQQVCSIRPIFYVCFAHN